MPNTHYYLRILVLVLLAVIVLLLLPNNSLKMALQAPHIDHVTEGANRLESSDVGDRQLVTPTMETVTYPSQAIKKHQSAHLSIIEVPRQGEVVGVARLTWGERNALQQRTVNVKYGGCDVLWDTSEIVTAIAEVPGYVSLNAARLRAGVSAELLVTPGRLVKIEVVDSSRGDAPIAGVTCNLYVPYNEEGMAGAQCHTSVTGIDGTCSLTAPAHGTVMLKACAKDGVPASKAISLRDDTQVLRVDLAVHVKASVKIVDMSTGKGLSGATLQLWTKQDGDECRKRANVDGEIDVESPTGETLLWKAGAQGYAEEFVLLNGLKNVQFPKIVGLKALTQQTWSLQDIRRPLNVVLAATRSVATRQWTLTRATDSNGKLSCEVPMGEALKVSAFDEIDRTAWYWEGTPATGSADVILVRKVKQGVLDARVNGWIDGEQGSLDVQLIIPATASYYEGQGMLVRCMVSIANNGTVRGELPVGRLIAVPTSATRRGHLFDSNWNGTERLVLDMGIDWRVQVLHDGVPVPGASVYAREDLPNGVSLNASTDKEGWAVLRGVSPQVSHSVTARANDRAKRLQGLIPVEGPRSIDTRVSQYVLHGKVSDEQMLEAKGRGIEVCVIGDISPHWVTAQADGSFDVEVESDQAYTVRCSIECPAREIYELKNWQEEGTMRPNEQRRGLRK